MTGSTPLQSESAARSESWQAVVDLAPDAIARFDRQGRYTYLNRANEQVTGKTWSHCLGKTEEELDLPAHWTAAWQAILRRVVETGKALEGRLQMPTSDGPRYYALSAIPKRGEDNSVSDVWRYLHDITAQQEAEQQLKELNETLEQRVIERTTQLRVLAVELSQAEERERQRLARILHDHLQQLLVAGRLNISAMQRRLLDAPLRRSTERLDEVLEEAIRTSRSLTAELSPPILYDAGLASGLHWLAHWMDEKYGLQVRVDAVELGNQTPDATRGMLFQAARELLFNVVQHAGVDRAQMRLRHLPDDEIELTVSDKGVGFDPSLIGRTEDGGFRLFSLQERLELLGGQIEVESSPEQGTRVTLRVPQHPTPSETAAGTEQATEQRVGAQPREEKKANERPVRVLLADYHLIVRQGLARLLAAEPGIELVGQVANGQDALTLAHMTRPDVVLMDITMPGMDGIEATRLLLNEQLHVKVIGLSMHGEEEIAQAMQQAGAVDYIYRGGDPTALVQTVLRWGQGHQNE